MSGMGRGALPFIMITVLCVSFSLYEVSSYKYNIKAINKIEITILDKIHGN